MLTEFVRLPSRLASSPLYRSSSTIHDDVTHSQGDEHPTSAAAERNDQVVVVGSRHHATYYSNWKSSHHAAATTRQMSLMHADGLDGRQRLSPRDGDGTALVVPNFYNVLLYLQGGPRKVKPTTILLVTFERMGKIQ